MRRVGHRRRESRELTIMAAAPPDIYEALLPAFGAMGDKPFHVGRRQGQGAAVKAIDQLLCGVHMAAAAEAPAFAGKLGADPQVVLQIMGGSAASSWMLRDRGPRMLEAGPEVTSAMDIFVKTWASCWRGGGMPEQRCPVAAVAHQLFLAASGGARARPTTARSIRTYHAMNGTTRQGG